MLKILYAAVNVIYIIAWLMGASFTKAAITNMDLEPLDEYEGAEQSDEEHDDGDVTTAGDEAIA